MAFAFLCHRGGRAVWGFLIPKLLLGAVDHLFSDALHRRGEIFALVDEVGDGLVGCL